MRFSKILVLAFSLSCFISTLFACEKNCKHGKTWAGSYVTFSFVSNSYVENDIAKRATVYPFGTKLEGISAGEAKQLVRKAASVWSQLSNLKLVEVADCEDVQIRIGDSSLSGQRAGFGYFPGNKAVNGDIHVDISDRQWNISLFYKVILHEMGHSLGMVHNKAARSIMYYRATEVNEPCDLDIAHIQNLYGAPAPKVVHDGISLSWQAAQFNGREVPYYNAQVSSSHSSKGEVVEVTISSKSELRNFTVKSAKMISGDADTSFFTVSKGWTKSISADSKRNRNQCLRLTSQQFIATENSEWNIERAFIFHGTEQIRYTISTDGGVSFQTLEIEAGASKAADYRKAAHKARSIKSISLAKFTGKEVIVALEYKNTGLYWNTKNHGVQISELTLNDIVKNSAEQQVFSNAELNFHGDNFQRSVQVAADYGTTKTWSSAHMVQQVTLAAK
ncbi:MAG: matrixin family metalloprotease [Lentisphaeraceae bacterium]|nr:matrixin family metalloprotease [Lentisphaeraceae bacterium]